MLKYKHLLNLISNKKYIFSSLIFIININIFTKIYNKPITQSINKNNIESIDDTHYHCWL